MPGPHILPEKKHRTKQTTKTTNQHHPSPPTNQNNKKTTNQPTNTTKPQTNNEIGHQKSKEEGSAETGFAHPCESDAASMPGLSLEQSQARLQPQQRMNQIGRAVENSITW